MEQLKKEQCTGLSLDHLGLVADVIHKLGLVEHIDKRLPIKDAKRAKTTMGERAAAMILNGLGFSDTRLYMFPKFLQKRPVKRLYGKDLKPEYFNDDSLGRCLDAIARYGVTKLFTELSFAVAKQHNLLGTAAHFDTTTVQLYGAYNVKDDATGPMPAHGYSKSKRHDLKQVVLNLATMGKAAFPIWMQAHSGNASDQKILPAAASRMSDLCKQLAMAKDFIYVGDAAMYANVLPYSAKLKWLSRVPSSLLLAKQLITSPDQALKWESLPNGYRYHVCSVNRRGVQQRWLLVHSSQSYERELKTLERTIAKEYQMIEKAWWHLSNTAFKCGADAQKAADKLAAAMKFHCASYKVEPKKSYTKRGRPGRDAKTFITGYQITYTLSKNQEACELAKRGKGRFILSTNELCKTTLPDAEILYEYKRQSGTERGFKFIKDSAFQVDSVFLKTPRRIGALMMIMTLCLMVYGFAQHQLRESLEKHGATMPDQQGRPTAKPSMKWVYFLFKGVHELTVKVKEHVQTLVINLTPLLIDILQHFGPKARAIYLDA